MVDVVVRMLPGAIRLVPFYAACVLIIISGKLILRLLGSTLLILSTDRTTLLDIAAPKPCNSLWVFAVDFLVHAAMHMRHLCRWVVLTMWPVSLDRHGVASAGIVSATKLAWLWPRPCVVMPIWHLARLTMVLIPVWAVLATCLALPTIPDVAPSDMLVVAVMLCNAMC